MTFSRGGIFTIIGMSAVITAILGVRWSPRKVLVGVVITTLATVSLISNWSAIEDASSSRFNLAYVGAMFAGANVDRSTVHRVKEGELAVAEAARRFPFGAGPNREHWREEIRVIESLYGHHLLKWGAIGLLLYLVSVAAIIAAGLKVYRTYRHDSFIPVFVLASAFVIASVPAVFGFSSAMSDRFKVLGFYYLLAGYVCALWEGAARYRDSGRVLVAAQLGQASVGVETSARDLDIAPRLR
jgi:hypothetical protein